MKEDDQAEEMEKVIAKVKPLKEQLKVANEDKQDL